MPRTARTTPTPIPQIQGRGALSPYDGKALTTTGVVTAVQRSETSPGFYLQDMKGDGDAATSDALFVNMTRAGADALNDLTPGTKATVSGTVKEENQFTQVLANARNGVKFGRQAASDLLQVRRASHLPPAVPLEIPNSPQLRESYLEAREAMLTTLPNAMVFAPSNSWSAYSAADEKTHGVGRDLGSTPDPRHIRISGRLGPKPQMVTGDRVGGVFGPLGASYGEFEVQQSRNYERIQRGAHPPRRWGDLDADDRVDPQDIERIKSRVGELAGGPLDAADVSGDGKITAKDAALATRRMELAKGGPGFTIASMNVKDFFDPDDAPPPVDDEVPSPNEYESKLARISGAIRDKLGMPDMLALQEVENPRVLDDLLARPELKSFGYKYAMLQTNGHRSINPALVYRGDKVDVSNVRQLQHTVPADRSPVANAAIAGIEFEKPGQPNGPLFAREPLLVDVTVKDGDQQQHMTVMVNHLISKFSPTGAPTDPIRISQAKFLNKAIQDLRKATPGREIIVLGDMNDTPDSKAMKALVGKGAEPLLHDVLSTHVPPAERYSYNFKGQHQLIDHILVTSGLAGKVDDAGVRHFNADLPEGLGWGTGAYRATDHDPPFARFRLGAGAVEDAAAGAAGASSAGVAGKASAGVSADAPAGVAAEAS